MRLLVLAGSMFPAVLFAQHLPDLSIPSINPGNYESLQAKTNLRKTSDFQMNGPVETVFETIEVFQSARKDSCAVMSAEYRFSRNANLLSYSEDTNTFLLRYSRTQSNYYYDSTGEILLQRVTIDGPLRHRSRSIVRYNRSGFIAHEDFVCFDCVSGSDRNNPFYDRIFDYSLDYSWTADFDSVSLKYHYVKPQSPYQRNRDVVLSFVHEVAAKKDPKEKNKRFDELASYYALLEFSETIKYDEKGRITERTMWDHSIKNSMNIHRRTQYSYNEKGELTGIRQLSSTEGYFELDFRVEIDYISYDGYGNWTEREVRVIAGENKWYGMIGNTVYLYKREFTYY